MTNRKGQTLNRAKTLLLAGAGFAALAGPVAIGVVIGIGHIPTIHAQSPAVIPSALPNAPAAPASATRAVTAASTAPSPTASPDHRLVAMLFDFTGMTSSEQSLLRQSGVDFVKNLKPADLASVMVVSSGPPRVAQDFTADTAVLSSAIQNLGGGFDSNSAAPANSKLAAIGAASKMLAVLPDKKALVYFSSGVTQVGSDNRDELRDVINTAKQANVAVYPIDIRGLASSAPTPEPGAGGRGPAGVSLEEYNRRVTYAQANFGSTTSAMSRSYIRYGAPDQIGTSTSSQIWRYNYLEDFQSGAAFEFTGKGPLGARIVYPTPSAIFEGRSNAPRLTDLAAALNPATTAVAEFPGSHATIQIYPVFPGMAPDPSRRFASVSVPVQSLSGQVDILGQVKTRPANGAPGVVAAAVRDRAQASAGNYEAHFTLPPGSYVCALIVNEPATGKTYGETIDFDVK